MLATQFVTDWAVHHPDREVLRRDLAKQPVPYIDETWVAAKFTSKEQYTPELAAAIQLSDRLIVDLLPPLNPSYVGL
jgi:FMN-dependent NADH-azoreductase